MQWAFFSIFSGSEENRRSFASYGTGPYQLRYPYGVTFSATGNILVCEQYKKVFSSDGKLLKCVGTKGSSFPIH